MQDVAVGNSPISLSAVCPLPRFEIDDAKPHKVIKTLDNIREDVYLTSSEYRNDPMFLRNHFNGDGTFEMPKIKKEDIDLEKIELITYSHITVTAFVSAPGGDGNRRRRDTHNRRRHKADNYFIFL